MSLNLKAKFRITERGGFYFLQERRLFRWVDCFNYAGLTEPYPFTTTESIHEVLENQIWWRVIRESRKHDTNLFIRERKKDA